MWNSSDVKKSALSHAQLESVILERTTELQILTQRLLKVQDEERRKLARDLHDSTGQTLAALKISVSLLLDTYPQDSKTLAIVADVAELANQVIEEIRTMSYLLHPPLLDEIGFTCAAEWFIEGFSKRSGIDVGMDLAAGGERLPMSVEIALFRVLQEGLTNVHRHSEALRAMVTFRRNSTAATLEIRDYGRGIQLDRLARLREASAEAGVGLAGMRERVHEFSGHLEIESSPEGTVLRATVPLPVPPANGRSAESQEKAHFHGAEVHRSQTSLSTE